jgi:hypothetical protein
MTGSALAEKALFSPLTDREAQIELFRRCVRMVEIETFSYCNRKCWFCPNAALDRSSANHYLDPRLYTSILVQLAAIEYSGMISFSRYNEPLADRVILERIGEARALLPCALLHSNTNGDYLTRGYLEELRHAGLNSLNIQVYLANRESYDHDKMRARMDAIIAGLGLPAEMTVDREGEWLESGLRHEGMRIRIYARNFEVNGCSRGDRVPVRREFMRTAPCSAPFEHVIIDHNGKWMPCCNLRSDIEEHQAAIIADLAADDDLFAAFASPALAAWRRHLAGEGAKSGLCRTCAFGL